MVLPGPLQSAFDWILARAQAYPELAVFGVVAAAFIGIFWVLLLLRALLQWSSTLRSAVTARAHGRRSQPGYRVLLSPIEGRGGGKAYKFLASAAEQHMSSFSFGAPLRLNRTAQIQGGSSRHALRSARRRLRRSGADLIVWGEQAGRGIEGLNVYSLSRAGGLTADEALLERFMFPGSSQKRREGADRVAAYLLAKRLQPSLGRPSDFRAERLEPVAQHLESLLEIARNLSPRIQNELERDFSAAALHIGEAGGDDAWLEKVIEMRKRTVARLGSVPQAGVWAEANLDLGRAMIAKAERRFDAQIVEEGSKHLRAAIEILKADPSIRRAEDAMRTLDSARTLAANRERFSINFTG